MSRNNQGGPDPKRFNIGHGISTIHVEWVTRWWPRVPSFQGHSRQSRNHIHSPQEHLDSDVSVSDDYWFSTESFHFRFPYICTRSVLNTFRRDSFSARLLIARVMPRASETREQFGDEGEITWRENQTSQGHPPPTLQSVRWYGWHAAPVWPSRIRKDNKPTQRFRSHAIWHPSYTLASVAYYHCMHDC